MDNKRTTILAFVAVAVMLAVCFIGFAVVGDDGSDAATTGSNTQKDSSVASVKIGETITYFDTIDDAVQAAQPNDTGNKATVTLLKNATTSSELSFWRSGEYVLDIGEYDLTYGGGSYLITVGGSKKAVYPVDTLNLDAHLTIIGDGNINSEKSVFRSYGKMVLGQNGVGPTVSIYNISDAYSIFKVEEGSYMTVNGGEFNLSTREGNAVKRVMQNFGTTVINNGTFNGNIDLWAYTDGSDKHYTSTVTINGGTVNGQLLRLESASSSTYKLADGDTFVVKGGSFTDLANAVNYAASGKTIKLADDVTISKTIEISKDLTIDLNGHKITSTKTVFMSSKGITLNIDGTEQGSTIEAPYVVWANHVDNAIVNINGGTYTGADYAFIMYSNGGKFTMKDATVSAKTCGLWVSNYPSSVEISDSKITVDGKRQSTFNDYCVGVELSTISTATLTNVEIDSSYIGIEIKSGSVDILGNSKITSHYYSSTAQMGSGVNGGSISAVCINNAYVGTNKSPNVDVEIGEDVVLSNTADDAVYPLIITSGYKGYEGSFSVVDNAPIFVTSGLSADKVGIVYSDATTKAATSAITYNGITYISNQDMYDAISDNEKVSKYYFLKGATISVEGSIKPIELANGAQLSIAKDEAITGTITGPDNNKLVANGMKAGEDGITITGGSLIINGEIIKADDTYSGVTVKIVSGTEVYISGQLKEGATMEVDAGTTVTIENDTTFTSNGTITNNGSIVNAGTITNNGSIVNAGTITNEGTITNASTATITNSGSIENKSSIVNEGTVESTGTVTNTGTLKMTEKSTVTGTVVNNGIVADERAAGSEAVTIDTKSTGAVVTKTNADSYGKDVKVIVEDPETTPVSEGTITSTSDSYGFVSAVTTTGKLEIVLSDGYKTYTLTIPKDTVIAMGTVVSVEYLDFTSDTTKYEITTPGITEFSVKVPVQTGFKSAKVYCDGSTAGVSNVKYNASQGYVTFDAGHNSTFTIVLSNATPSSGTSDAIDENTAFVGAIVVLVVAILALAIVIKRR